MNRLETMDRLEIIVLALVLGATAGLKPTAAQAVKDSYARLKTLIARKYTQIHIDQFEALPISMPRWLIIKGDLLAAGADADVEVLLHAKMLIEVIRSHVPEIAAAIDVELQDIEEAAPNMPWVAVTVAAVKVERPWSMAANLNNLAMHYEVQGRAAEAELLYQRALAIAERHLGPDHPGVAISLNNLAAVYQGQGRYTAAEPLYRRALTILEQAVRSGHPEVTQSLSNLAELHLAQGSYTAAEPLYRRALAIREQVLGPAHPAVAASLSNLAELHLAQGRYGAAEPLLQRALALQEQVLGPAHPAVAASLSNLAELHLAQGSYTAAEPLYRRALAIREQVLGPAHPAVAASLSNLAELHLAQGRYGAAEPLLQRALALQEQVLGPAHPAVAGSLSNLAELHLAQGSYTAAEPLYRRALAIAGQAFGFGHQEVTRSSNSLVRLFEVQGRVDEAELFHQHALPIRRALMRREQRRRLLFSMGEQGAAVGVTIDRVTRGTIEIKNEVERVDTISGRLTGGRIEALGSVPNDTDRLRVPEPATSPLQWNTGLPRDTTAEKLRALFVGVPYLLRTAIQAGENTIGDLTTGETVPQPSAEHLETTAEGARFFTVQFGVWVAGAVVRRMGSGLTPGPEAMSDALQCVLGRGTPAFDVELTATAAGLVNLELTLYVNGGATLRRKVTLTAIDFASGAQPGTEVLEERGGVLSGAGENLLPPLQRDGPNEPISSTAAGLASSSTALPALDAMILPVGRLRRRRPTDAHVAVKREKGKYWLRLLQASHKSDPVYAVEPAMVLAKTVITERNKLIKLSKAYRAASAHADDPLAGLRILEPSDALLQFARIGARLHRALFGRRGDRGVQRDLHNMADAIAKAGRGAPSPPCLQIDAEFLPIPWAVIYDGPEPTTADEVDLEAFWGVRFRIQRIALVTLSEEEPDYEGATSIIACLNPHLDQEQKIAVLEQQRAFFRGEPVQAALIETNAALEAFLRKKVDKVPCSFLYFFCHATAAQTLNRNLFHEPTSPKDAATIELDKPPLSVEQLCDIRIDALPAQPLVFMNTCSSAQGDSVFQSVFLTHFFGTWRAGGVIGTDWTLPTVFADGFARLFLQYFLVDRHPIANAFHRAAGKVFELRNPFPLIYALYVQPDYTL